MRLDNVQSTVLDLQAWSEMMGVYLENDSLCENVSAEIRRGHEEVQKHGQSRL